MKCAQYWPGSGKQVYGELSVVFLGENRLVDYTIRKFTIQQVGVWLCLSAIDTVAGL